MKNRRGLLQLEGLTERIVPAVSIRAVDGDLIISGIANTTTGFQRLFLTVNADNTVQIRDGGTTGSTGTDRGTYSVTGDLFLNLSNRKDSVIISMENGSTLDGGIIANLGNGNDELTIQIPDDEASATIFGGVEVNGGNGNDKMVVFKLDTDEDETETLTIQGGLSFNGGAGNDTANINQATDADPVVFGDSVTLTRVNTVNIGITDTVTIHGTTTINNASDKLVTNTITVGTTAVSIAGTLAITGGQGNDTVTLDTVSIVDVVPAEDEVLEININLDRGNNSLTMDAVTFGMAGTDADFAYTGGKGTDEITFTGTNAISGDATFTLGNGVNELTTNADTAFDSDVTITGGAVADTITLSTATILGLLTATLGNGANELTSAGTIDGGLSYTGGSNVDTVTLSDGDNLAGDVSISTGAGADVVEISGTATVSLTSLTLDLGIDSAADSLDYDSVFDGLITILNQGSGDIVTSV